MEKSVVQADFQLMDNYISEFSLNVFNKIKPNINLGINANIGFRIVSSCFIFGLICRAQTDSRHFKRDSFD